MPTSWMTGTQRSYLYMWTRGFAHFKSCTERLFFFSWNSHLSSSFFCLSQILTVHLRASGEIPRLLNLGTGQSCRADVMSVPNKAIWQQRNKSKNGPENKQLNSDYTHCLEPPLREAVSFHLCIEWTAFRSAAIATGASLPKKNTGFKSIWTFDFYQPNSLKRGRWHRLAFRLWIKVRVAPLTLRIFKPKVTLKLRFSPPWLERTRQASETKPGQVQQRRVKK